MATAAVAPRDIEITLTLTSEEALYVWSALLFSQPRPIDRLSPNRDDTVFVALDNALTEADISTDGAGSSYVRLDESGLRYVPTEEA